MRKKNLGRVFLCFFSGPTLGEDPKKRWAKTLKKRPLLKGWLGPQNLEFHRLQLPCQNKTSFLITSAQNRPKCPRTLRTLKTLKKRYLQAGWHGKKKTLKHVEKTIKSVPQKKHLKKHPEFFFSHSIWVTTEGILGLELVAIHRGDDWRDTGAGAGGYT